MQLHGTCLGFEALAVIVTGNASILSRFDSYNDPSPLVLTEDGRQGSAFFGSFPQSVLQGLQDQPLAMENHGKGVQFQSFNSVIEGYSAGHIVPFKVCMIDTSNPSVDHGSLLAAELVRRL